MNKPSERCQFSIVGGVPLFVCHSRVMWSRNTIARALFFLASGGPFIIGVQ